MCCFLLFFFVVYLIRFFYFYKLVKLIWEILKQSFWWVQHYFLIFFVRLAQTLEKGISKKSIHLRSKLTELSLFEYHEFLLFSASEKCISSFFLKKMLYNWNRTYKTKDLGIIYYIMLLGTPSSCFFSITETSQRY